MTLDVGPRTLTVLAAALLATCVGCDRPSGSPTSNRGQPGGAALRPTANADTSNDESQTRSAMSSNASSSEDSTARTTKLRISPQSDQLWAARHMDNRLRIRLGDVKLEEPLFADTDQYTSVSRSFQRAALPSNLRHLDEWVVLTPSGPVRVETDEVVRSGGSDDPTYYVKTAPSDAFSDLRLWTLSAPAGRIADNATFRYPDVAARESMRAIGQRVAAETDDRFEKPLEAPITGFEPRYRVVEGHFPAPHKLFVTVEVVDAPSASACHLCAFVFADDAGEVTQIVDVVKGFRGRHLGPRALADPDGDGHEGVLFASTSDDRKLRWVEFDNGNVVERSIAGVKASRDTELLSE